MLDSLTQTNLSCTSSLVSHVLMLCSSHHNFFLEKRHANLNDFIRAWIDKCLFPRFHVSFSVCLFPHKHYSLGGDKNKTFLTRSFDCFCMFLKCSCESWRLHEKTWNWRTARHIPMVIASLNSRVVTHDLQKLLSRDFFLKRRRSKGTQSKHQWPLTVIDNVIFLL